MLQTSVVYITMYLRCKFPFSQNGSDNIWKLYALQIHSWFNVEYSKRWHIMQRAFFYMKNGLPKLEAITVQYLFFKDFPYLLRNFCPPHFKLQRRAENVPTHMYRCLTAERDCIE